MLLVNDDDSDLPTLFSHLKINVAYIFMRYYLKEHILKWTSSFGWHIVYTEVLFEYDFLMYVFILTCNLS